MLFDFHTQQWTRLAEAALLNGDGLTWSKDAKSLYFQDLLGRNEAVYSARIDNRKIELAASFEALLRNGAVRVTLSGIGPDGRLIVAVDRGGSNALALP